MISSKYLHTKISVSFSNQKISDLLMEPRAAAAVVVVAEVTSSAVDEEAASCPVLHTSAVEVETSWSAVVESYSAVEAAVVVEGSCNVVAVVEVLQPCLTC